MVPILWNLCKVAEGKEELSNGDFKMMLAAGLEGIKRRGKAVVGEKTMVDALEPAAEAFAVAAEDKAPWMLSSGSCRC